MARLAFSMMILFVACTAVTVTPGFGSDYAEAPSPSLPHQVLPPEPYSGYYKYLDSCTTNITVDCGAELVGALLKTNVASYDCCHSLIDMGKDCHDALIKAIASLDEYKSYASIIPQRGSELWNYCAHVAAAAPTPSQV